MNGTAQLMGGLEVEGFQHGWRGKTQKTCNGQCQTGVNTGISRSLWDMNPSYVQRHCLVWTDTGGTIRVKEDQA